jgi:hypothetical protein
MRVVIDWERFGRAFSLRVENTPGPARRVEEALGLSHATFYRAMSGKPATTETYLTICDWLGESPYAFQERS